MSPKAPATMHPKNPMAKRLQEFFGGENFVEISKKISISDRQVANSLRGDTKPSLKLLEYIANNGGDVHYVLTGERKTPTAEAYSSLTSSQKLALAHLKTLFDMLLDTYHIALTDPAEAEEIANLLESLSSTLTRKAQ